MNKNFDNSSNKYRFPKKKYNEDIRKFIADNINQLKQDSTILDAGCDTGYLSNQFLSKHRIIGVDRNRDSIESCRKNYPEGQYEVADLSVLPFQDNFFDAIIFNMIIEHIREQDKVLPELYRVMKKQGVMLITTPNYANLLWVIIENIWFRFFERDFKPYSREVHPNRFNSKILRECLLKYFEVLNINEITYGFTLTAIVSK